MLSLWRIAQLLPQYAPRVVQIAAISLASAALAAGTPYLYKFMVDIVSRMPAGDVSAAVALDEFGLWLVLFALVKSAHVALVTIQGNISTRLLFDSLSSLREKILDKMNLLGIDYYERTHVGDIMDRWDNGVSVISWWVNALCNGALTNILQVFFIIAVLCSKFPPIGSAITAVMAFALYDSYRSLVEARPFHRGWSRHRGLMSGLMAEFLSHIATVRSFSGEAVIRDRYLESQAIWRDLREKAHQVTVSANLRRNAINTLAVFGATSFVSWAALHGRYNPGDILLVLILTESLTGTIAPISALIGQIGEAEAAAERLLELLRAEAGIVDPPDAKTLTSVDTIAFDRVSFTYPGKRAPALENVSFFLAKSQSLALAGPSGAGKSTIIKLLLRFYDANAGRILINGEDIRHFSQVSVRSLFGVVLQEAALFNDTVAGNIAFARQGAGIDAVRAAARKAYAHEFIERLPQGYETLVGERGVRLSGGEKQRISIARAVLKDPQLIILDEATSALDSESEQLVQSGLRDLMQGRTSLVIAHRLSTIANADIIAVMREGKIVETGRHDALIASPDGLYARLHALQSGKQSDVIADGFFESRGINRRAPDA